MREPPKYFETIKNIERYLNMSPTNFEYHHLFQSEYKEYCYCCHRFKYPKYEIIFSYNAVHPLPPANNRYPRNYYFFKSMHVCWKKECLTYVGIITGVTHAT